ncbi:hypothetical protein SS1G_08640 [Sclerotinia sclerotiorum 1980 UF-70]|uniref:Uncharacterized protein n=2 Tax=Sclerotinia sclerotiorum (strain ATCC 18683 / 1980 / Ss-1) TaxID=665079 RepID=A7ETI4_SCLS1|nr:hypothetical protein SS1G_08640 [Sclerotinia sclerotiorum 1980 UF-70]APA13118.1 hypothetical protein sscle_10g078880 [Sclerotinia sclerotiorum 1980 UF-70]EDN92776.1 hypothetical protein SS1G_08640 [Sclerotinia sclerotiorum 1980 UF-70]
MGLQKLIAPRFNFWVNEYIRDIIPILLIRSLASTQPGQEASNNCYKLHVKTKKKTPVLRKNVEVLLSAVTSMDIPAWKAEFTKVFQEEEVLPVDEMVECKDLLSCIIDHGIEKALLPNTPSYEHDRNIVSPEMMFKNKKRAGSIVPNKASSSSQEQPPSKRVKSIPGQSSRSTPPSKALMEPVSPHHTEITFQPRKTSSSTKKTPIRDIPEVARDRMSPEQRRESESEKHPRQRDVKKSSVLTIDLMLDDSDEENPIPVTSAQTHTSKSSSSQTSPTSTNREARFRHFGSDMRKQASISTAQQSSFGASPNSRIESQSSPLAKKSLPQGMKEEDFDGFFFSVFDELMGLRGYSLLSCPGNFIP